MMVTKHIMSAVTIVSTAITIPMIGTMVILLVSLSLLFTAVVCFTKLRSAEEVEASGGIDATEDSSGVVDASTVFVWSNTVVLYSGNVVEREMLHS